MSTLRTFIVWVVVLILLALFSWGLTLYMQWPLWGMAAVFLGVLGTYFLTRFVIRLVQVYRSRSRMTQLTAANKSNVGKPLAAPYFHPGFSGDIPMKKAVFCISKDNSQAHRIVDDRGSTDCAQQDQTYFPRCDFLVPGHQRQVAIGTQRRGRRC